ncbi:hypothetical protein ABGT15_02070 [Flavobacterium enshiense]|uniref:hypothetical protein n=1 Tax=Flavobacterium enshiense TaxID=1341165 RepID=UPI00345D730B
MKRITFFLFLLTISPNLFAQEQTTTVNEAKPSVAKSIFGVQVGVLGGWVYNELKLSDKIALRSEIGMQTFVYSDLATDDSYYFLVPEVAIEPRWYYNLNKRNEKGKNILNNSGNFISLRNAYASDAFKVGGPSDVDFIPELHLVPSWGIRRNLGKHFNYECSLGLGYRKVFETNNKVNNNNEDVAYNFQARIGYKF